MNRKQNKINLINKILEKLKDKFIYTNTFIGFLIQDNIEKSLTIIIEYQKSPINHKEIIKDCPLRYNFFRFVGSDSNEEINEYTVFPEVNQNINDFTHNTLNILLIGLQNFLLETENLLFDNKFKKVEQKKRTVLYLNMDNYNFNEIYYIDDTDRINFINMFQNNILNVNKNIEIEETDFIIDSYTKSFIKYSFYKNKLLIYNLRFESLPNFGQNFFEVQIKNILEKINYKEDFLEVYLLEESIFDKNKNLEDNITIYKQNIYKKSDLTFDSIHNPLNIIK